MRIYLFNKLIDAQEAQLCSLRDCPVVIDGQNFLHNVYERNKIPFVFGCEADKYADKLKEFFQIFKKANITCYVVFKGGDTDIMKKIKKFQLLMFNINTITEFIPPVLLKDTNVQFVDEMGINYAFCVTEVKDECVALALKLECPIISYDIEYCFRKAPYIPEDTLKFDESTNSILCLQYKLQDFLQKNSLTEEKIAIFVSLTDTTVFPNEFFETLFNKWRVSHWNNMYCLRNLIVWLSQHSEQEARDGISGKLTKDEENSIFWTNYSQMLTNMRKDAPGHVTEYLLNSELPIVPQDSEWFEKGVVCKHVPPVYINLYKWKVIEGDWVILDKLARDRILLSIDIVKYAFNLLTNYSVEKFKVYQDANKYAEVTTNDLRVSRPTATYNCQVSVFENGWDQVRDLGLFEHFLTQNHINTEVLATLQPDCMVLFTALVFFTRKKNWEDVNVTKEVYAVLMSYVLLKDCEDHLNAKRAAAKYFKYNNIEAIRIYDGKALHRFVELQLCIQHMNYLNTLCGSPYESTQYRKLYNGTLIYKMFIEMRDRDAREFVNELFESSPIALELVNQLIRVYHELLNSEYNLNKIFC